MYSNLWFFVFRYRPTSWLFVCNLFVRCQVQLFSGNKQKPKNKKISAANLEYTNLASKLPHFQVAVIPLVIPEREYNLKKLIKFNQYILQFFYFSLGDWSGSWRSSEFSQIPDQRPLHTLCAVSLLCFFVREQPTSAQLGEDSKIILSQAHGGRGIIWGVGRIIILSPGI